MYEMNYQSVSDIFFADACLTYILDGIFCTLCIASVTGGKVVMSD